jgi:hypothetical protein
MPRLQLKRYGRWLIVVAAAVGLPAQTLAIPVFARIYGKPCAACHTTFPQLNPAGEYFRAKGLHGIEPVIRPIRLGDHFAVPGTIPLALTFAAGEDITRTHTPGTSPPTNTHFNLNYLAVLAGGELGPHLAFLADYAPLFSIPQTGEVKESTRLGLGLVQAHAEPAGWLLNLRVGLQELPLGTSPRVHRLSQQPYLLYNLTAFSLLGKSQPGSANSFVLSSTQIASEFSGLDPDSGRTVVAGVSAGSNNRLDNNDAKDLYLRIGQAFDLHRVGLFAYYSPNVLAHGASDQVVRVGSDLSFYERQAGVRAQFLAGYDSNPTEQHDALWYYGTFVEGEYRWTPMLASLARVEYAWTPTFDDRSDGGTTHVRRRLWQVVGGTQWSLQENLKLVAEAAYGENIEAVSARTTNSWALTMRIQTAFWLLTPPGLESWLPPPEPGA